ncbi:type II toxin-antitoxin system RnlA family toxin [Candidatus Woesebacteria bacterium]|nr:type II toxin-antitoxin system RnlA family toxin [Candidatus Woesebacteria bacterium]
MVVVEELIKFQLKDKAWWNYLEEDLQELLDESFLLAEMGENWQGKFHDYAFVVFPAAKAYEGFLKKIFRDMDFISDEDYFGKHFRIGKALNPSLPKDLEEHSVYKKLVRYCGGSTLADKLWDTWKNARNLTFHWFPNEKNALSYTESKGALLMIIEAMDEAFKGCKIKSSNSR